jgi:hypothetical protein
MATHLILLICSSYEYIANCATAMLLMGAELSPVPVQLTPRRATQHPQCSLLILKVDAKCDVENHVPVLPSCYK